MFKDLSFGFVLFVVFNVQVLHHIEEGRRIWVIQFLLFIHTNLANIDTVILFQTHEIAWNQDRHIVIAQHYHIANLVRSILWFFLSPINEQVIDFKTAVLYLLLGFLSFRKYGSWLSIIIAIDCFEIGWRILVTLMNDSDDID